MKQVASCYITVFVFVSFLFLSFRADAASLSAHEITVAYQPFASPVNVVMEAVKRDRTLRKALAMHGFSVRFIPAYKGSDVAAGLRRGEIIFATAGDMPTLELAATTSVRVIAQVKQNYATVVGARGQAAKDLKGKKIATVFASSGHFALLKTLSSAGLSERDINLMMIEVSDMPDALLSGKIDAFSAWEPIPTMSIERNPERFAAIGRQVSLAYMVVLQKFADQHPEVVYQMNAALIRAMNWLKNDKNLARATEWNLAAIAALTARTDNRNAEQIRKTAARDLEVINHSPRIAPLVKQKGMTPLNDELEFMKSTGKLPKEANWEQISTIFDLFCYDHVIRNSRTYSVKSFDYEN